MQFNFKRRHVKQQLIKVSNSSGHYTATRHKPGGGVSPFTVWCRTDVLVTHQDIKIHPFSGKLLVTKSGMEKCLGP